MDIYYDITNEQLEHTARNINNKQKLGKQINTIPCQTYGMYTTQGSYLTNTCKPPNDTTNIESTNKISEKTINITTETTNKTDIDFSSISHNENNISKCEEFDTNSYESVSANNSNIKLVSHIKKCKSCKINNLTKHNNINPYEIISYEFKEILIISLLGFLVLLLIDIVINPK